MVPTSSPPSRAHRLPSTALPTLLAALSALVLLTAPATGQHQGAGAIAAFPPDPTCDPSDLFDPAVDYPTGSAPKFVAVGDLDGDGARDLVVANSLTVGVLINNGDGTFGAPTHYPMGVRSLPESLAIGDLNGDGAEDFASANVRRPSMLLNNGDGTFAPAVAYAVGLATQSVVIGDLDGDGARDLAAMNLATVDVGVLLNNGDGTFTDPAHYPIGARSLPRSLAIGDLDADGFRDLATVNQLRGDVSVLNVLINNGDGTFADSIEYDGAHASPASLAIEDLDGDGARDVVVANRGSNNVSVLLNRCAP